MLFPKSIRFSSPLFTLFPTLVKHFFIGFISGNIFGSFISLFIVMKGSAIFTLTFLIIALEMIYKFCFRDKGSIRYEKNQNLAIVFGLMLGFFVDAYKVGS